jgi:hypothetical protein
LVHSWWHFLFPWLTQVHAEANLLRCKQCQWLFLWHLPLAPAFLHQHLCQWAAGFHHSGH